MRRAIQLSLCAGNVGVLLLIIHLARRMHAYESRNPARVSDWGTEAMGIVWTAAYIGLAMTVGLAISAAWRERG